MSGDLYRSKTPKVVSEMIRYPEKIQRCYIINVIKEDEENAVMDVISFRIHLVYSLVLIDDTKI